ncbi:hypothetical protein [Accumulibacter sp.]|uniref:hypothetical protein n=1 Tax=Accumulibacter sp. TaxID=2053492 RepID=UPI0025E6AC00|nr:hypothetical protein [Accumulibacter sp.]MCM8610579.1 hypothetical protein [Accumulibacter sp.]MCM8634478.1 hypothetical protein [Accumulibacter sp.]MCM8641693.1 hypothetical protein [Accumulibacter sp.]
MACVLLTGDALAHSIADNDVRPLLAPAAAPLAEPSETNLPAAPGLGGALDEQEASPPWLSHGPLPLPAMPALDADEAAHSFAPASRLPPGRTRRQGSRGPAATPGGSPLPPPAGLLPGIEDILADLNNLQQAATDLIVETTDARIGPGGRVSFSIAGIEGFHYSARDGHAEIGHGGLALTVSDTSGDRRPPDAGGRTAPTIPASHDASPPLHLIELLREVLAYPLVWVLAFLLLAGKIALLVATRRGRKHRHRRRPVTRQQETPQRVRKRVRIRVRQRQPVVGLQQPR